MPALTEFLRSLRNIRTIHHSTMTRGMRAPTAIIRSSESVDIPSSASFSKVLMTFLLVYFWLISSLSSFTFSSNYSSRVSPSSDSNSSSFSSIKFFTCSVSVSTSSSSYVSSPSRSSFSDSFLVSSYWTSYSSMISSYVGSSCTIGGRSTGLSAHFYV